MPHRACSPRSVWTLSLLLLSLTAWSSPPDLGPREKDEPVGRARIEPSIIEMTPGADNLFKVVLLETRLTGAKVAEGTKWTVNDIPGGDDTFGRISTEGVFKAPAKAPVPREVHIKAEVTHAQNRYLWATVMFPGEGPPYKLVGEWSELNSKPKYLKDPHCIALDREGNLLIADYDGSQVHRFTPEGKFLGNLGLGTGEGPGYVTKPRVVTTDREGNIFVSDQKKDKPRIQMFTHEGTYVRQFGDKGNGPGQILRAHGLVFDSQDRLFVMDVDCMRVSIFNYDGSYVKTWGRDGPNLEDFNAPHGIAIDANDDIFVAGYYGPCQKFTADGKFLRAFAEPDPPDRATYFHSIVSDRWGNVYLTVRGASGFGGKVEDNEGNLVSVMKYNNNGDYVSSLRLNVKGHAENSAAVDRNGKVYAIYAGSERMGVEIFAPQ